MAERNEMAASFDNAAEVYERSRPEYPDAAVDWLLPEGANVVLDLGAGTGKLTRALTARGLEVLAVDPSPKMLDQLRKAVPDAVAYEGSAEDIPVADASVDAVLAAQAWHWVDQERALPAVARVLKPGGTLGLVWNLRDQRVPWVARLTDAMHKAEAEQFFEDREIEQGPFGPIEHATFEWTQTVSPDDLLELLRSRSYFITASADSQARLIANVRELLANDPDIGGAQVLTMPYVTECYRMRLPA